MPIEPSERAREAAAKYFAIKYGGGFGAHLACLDDGNTLVQAFANFEAETRKDERERCVKAIDGERLFGETDTQDDAAYNRALDDALAAIRNLVEG